MKLKKSQAEHFWDYVEKTDTCWLWTAALINGYGRFWDGEREWKAHRWLWAQTNGAEPVGELQLDHLCRVRRCVRPDHLEAVSARENILRGSGLAALNAVKTACPMGHPYDSVNTGVSGGRRHCRACKRIHTHAWRMKNRCLVDTVSEAYELTDDRVVCVYP